MNVKTWFDLVNQKEYIAPVLLTGPNHQALEDWVLELLSLVFKKDKTDSLNTFEHPDFHWIYPKGASRKISMESAREIPQWLDLKSHSGGWIFILIHSADRLGNESSNALLKILEEPPSKTLIFLTSDQHEGILSTILSRCQRIPLIAEQGLLSNDDLEYQLVQEYFSLDENTHCDCFLWSEKVFGWLAEKKKSWENETQKQDWDQDQWKAYLSSRYRQTAENLIIEIQKEFLKISKDLNQIAILDSLEKSLSQLRSQVNIQYVFDYLALSRISS